MPGLRRAAPRARARISLDHRLRALHAARRPRARRARTPRARGSRNARSSSSPLTLPHAEAVRDRARRCPASRARSPRRLASGRNSSVRMLWRRSASLTSDDPQVRDHRQDHLAEGLGLLLLARDVGEPADLRQAVDELGDLGAELLRDRLLRRQRVLEDVVEEADDDRDVVGLQVGQDRRDVQRVDEVGLARAAHLALVLAGREDVGPPQQVLVAAAGCRPRPSRGSPRSGSSDAKGSRRQRGRDGRRAPDVYRRFFFFLLPEAAARGRGRRRRRARAGAACGPARPGPRRACARFSRSPSRSRRSARRRRSTSTSR